MGRGRWWWGGVGWGWGREGVVAVWFDSTVSDNKATKPTRL